MISLDRFYRAYKALRGYAPDREQCAALEPGPSEPLFIVAGPGTGKTTTLTLRILKLILVDDVPPSAILATTFTRKAAAELRSRVLGWGFGMIELLSADSKLAAATRSSLAKLDINQVVTGTIDSICESVLRDNRDPASQPPVLADEFVAATLMLREGLLNSERYKSQPLDDYLYAISGHTSKFGWNLGAKADLVASIWDRIANDLVDLQLFMRGGRREHAEGRGLLKEALDAYSAALVEREMVDFVLLESEVLQRLDENRLNEWRDQFRIVMVDEYQDTNPLQERLYFAIAEGANCKGALTVVGDDDQSLYRFRGATVELFTGFQDRYKMRFRKRPRRTFLTRNYRSTRRIIQFVNAYARLDEAYQDVRVRAKPALAAPTNAAEGVHVLGMFRDSVGELSQDLASLISKVFRGNGYRLPSGEVLKRASNGGDLGDCALLKFSPKETNDGSSVLLPGALRRALRAIPKPIEMFNPRGEDLKDIEVVQTFGGLLLLCIDPDGAVQARTRGLSDNMRQTMDMWRNRADRLLSSGGATRDLARFVDGWKTRTPGRSGEEWPRSVPMIDLVYALLHYFPFLYDDPEGQLYIEVFTRQLTACSQVGRFGGRVVTDATAIPDATGVTLPDRSVMELLRDFIGPIAGGDAKVTEELVESFPRNRLSVLSIHQSKGLEFPMVIVDVGSEFKTDHRMQAFKRFPTVGGETQALENLLRPFTGLGAPQRSPVDRAYDDLYRQYFVAFSRAKDVLLLVGLSSSLPDRSIPNVALGWSRDRRAHWARNRPFELI